MNPASYIDHTVLRQDTTTADVQRACDEALRYRFAAVCIPPVYVRQAAELLGGSSVKVATVIGFPFGYQLPMVKTTEAELAIIGGAQELDMVANISAIKNQDWRTLEAEVREVLETVKLRGARLKVIIESGILSADELKQCCALYSRFTIDFLKTSTGFAARGATLEAVETMHAELAPHIAIKASGGIRTWEFARQLISAGATRIGCSASLQIMQEAGAA